MKYLEELCEDVKVLIQDEDKVLTQSAIESCIKRAIRILSQRTPRIVFETFTGTGSAYEWALASDYIGRFSGITAVYYPWDDTDTPTPPPPTDTLIYTAYEKTAGTYYFRLNGITPSSSEYLRVYYTTRHSITSTTSSLTDEADEDSIVQLAAGFCCDILAQRAIALSNSNLQSDIVSYQTRQSQYSAMAKTFKTQSGLASYIAEQPQSGAASFVSCGRSKRVSDNL